MSKKLLLSMWLLALFLSSLLPVQAMENLDYLLPESFSVYVQENTVINHPSPGFEPRPLPTNNDYHSNPGCYLACYSRNANNSAYGVAGNMYVHGQVRINGHYVGRICQPAGYENMKISPEQSFKYLCDTKIASCNGSECWAGGDTGGWFGIQG